MKSQLGLSSGNSDFSAEVSMFEAGSTMRGNKVAIYQTKYWCSDLTRFTLQKNYLLWNRSSSTKSALEVRAKLKCDKKHNITAAITCSVDGWPSNVYIKAELHDT